MHKCFRGGSPSILHDNAYDPAKGKFHIGILNILVRECPVSGSSFGNLLLLDIVGGGGAGDYKMGELCSQNLTVP